MFARISVILLSIIIITSFMCGCGEKSVKPIKNLGDIEIYHFGVGGGP